MAANHGTHILVVDDEEGVRHLLRRILEPAGYEVRTATNAHEALRAMTQSAPAVVICDVHMPGPDGIWLAHHIREQSPHTAIILATFDASVPPTESMRPGIVAYILKPYDQQAVLTAVADAFLWWSTESQREVPPLVPRPAVNTPVPVTSAPANDRPLDDPAPKRSRSRQRARGRKVSARTLIVVGLVAVAVVASIASWKSRQSGRVLTRVAASAGMVVVYDGAGKTLVQGSGFFVAPDLFLTNHHIVDGGAATTIVIGTAEYRATATAGVDRLHDLVLLKTSSPAPSYLALAKRVPDQGDSIAVYGAPLGLTGTLTTGVVSTVPDPAAARLQITAPISPGSSGSPVVDGKGNVVGVAVSSNVLGQGLNFAVPANYVRALLDRISETQPLIAASRGAGDDRERHELIGPVRSVTKYSNGSFASRTQILFDRNGRLIEVRLGLDDAKTQYQYDDNGRLKAEIHSHGTAPADQWMFTPRGPHVVEATEPTSGHIKRVEYLEDGRLLLEEVRSGPQVLSSVRWTYDPVAWPAPAASREAAMKEARDALGNPTRRVLPDGSELIYTYDLDTHGNWVSREVAKQGPNRERTVISTERREIDYWE